MFSELGVDVSGHRFSGRSMFSESWGVVVSEGLEVDVPRELGGGRCFRGDVPPTLREQASTASAVSGNNDPQLSKTMGPTPRYFVISLSRR